MFSFQKKEITQIETTGEKLKSKRLAKGIDLENASEELQISETYLKAIENGGFDELPGEIYVKNFLQSYCDFLGLNFNEIFKEYENEKSIYKTVQKAGIEAFGGKPEKKAKYWYSFITFNLLKNLTLALLVAAGLTFLWFKINNIVAPPNLIIYSPESNLIIKDHSIEIVGRTDAGSAVNINDQAIMISPNGEFQDRLNLQSGLNIIKISAKKRYSKEAAVYRDIMVEQ